MSEKTQQRAVVKSAVMSEDMLNEAIYISADVVKKHKKQKKIAEEVKKAMDKKYGPTWHCVVGKNYGSSGDVRDRWLVRHNH
ncbi:hypothetical protein CRM22_005105 [Opisthorchis felineus]|uniref:Dynein light chain n=1 Tax=Opisthorchis felineus TaxID=147828 RepID=A0A4S2LYI7_OPIFE|nr:hypothetical protein CRM22_005105 [Opisthorchis felineus]TGZ66880.1 hypothetical protein CRM22_005105 [Opisthorchis felineus]